MRGFVHCGFVFAADEWRSGKSSGEPADLVWACNNCIILMHMTSRKHQENSERRIRVREDAIDHNLRQLRGWMKNWRDGRPLTGSNRYSKYSISYSDAFHVVALSVIECDDAEARPHNEIARELGIVAAATVPQSLLVGLTSMMGGTLDLILC